MRLSEPLSNHWLPLKNNNNKNKIK